MQYFNAVTTANVVGDGTIGALTTWLERYINTIFPDNGIEYWADLGFKKSIPVADAGGDEGLDHFACYVRAGHCEGRIIEIRAVMKSDAVKQIARIKTFGKEEECWNIASAFTQALESIAYWRELPEIVDMAEALPRNYDWERETSLKEQITVRVDDSSIKVHTAKRVLWERQYKDKPDHAQYRIIPRLADWLTVLKSMKAVYVVEDLRTPPPDPVKASTSAFTVATL